MVNQQGPQMSVRKDDVTTITDIDGTVVLEIGSHEYTVTTNGGSIIHRNINQTVQLVCGTVWSPLSKILVGICSQCREPSLFKRNSHSIVAISRTKICTECGTLCCPSHRKQGRDLKWRCLKHHKAHSIRNLIRPILFKRDEE